MGLALGLYLCACVLSELRDPGDGPHPHGRSALLPPPQVPVAEEAQRRLHRALQDGGGDLHPLVQVQCRSHRNVTSSRRLCSLFFLSPWCYIFFIFRIATQNFKREEQNFVVQNEINNLGFLTGEGKTNMSKVNVSRYMWLCTDVWSHAKGGKSFVRVQIRTE